MYSWRTPELRTPNYRSDVDGLRAIAVLSVIAYHAFPTYFPGGYIGVDIFFVISGYLISGILFHSLNAGKFTLIDFYQRRVRRIFPALILVLVSSLIFGWFWLMPAEYARLGVHTSASAFFAQNFSLWKATGYFTSAAEFKPLMHLWSLGVEEQFYLFYPLFVSLFWNKGRTTLFSFLMVIVIIASCAWNIRTQPIDPIANFYLPHTRLWELLLGGLICIRENSKRKQLVEHALAGAHAVTRPSTRFEHIRREVASILGLGLIVYAWLSFDRKTPYPGVNAIIPVLGAVLILSKGKRSFINDRVLGLKPLELIGLMSYPLYLWHWVVLAYGRLLTPGEPSLELKAGLVFGSFVLAWMTYEFVELPLRFGSSARTLWSRFKTALLVWGIVIIGVAGIGLRYFDGFPDRKIRDLGEQAIRDRHTVSESLRASNTVTGCEYEPKIDPRTYRFCTSFGDKNAPQTLVVWGDSHAYSWAPAFHKVAERRKMRVFVFSDRGCAPILGVRRSDPGVDADNCRNFTLAEAVLSSIRKIKPLRTFWIGRWSVYHHGWIMNGVLQESHRYLTSLIDGTANKETSRVALETKLPETMRLLSDTGALTVVKTVPVLKSRMDVGMTKDLGRYEPTLFSHREFESYTDAIIDRTIQILQAGSKDVSVLDPAELLCERKRCRSMMNLTALYADDSELTTQGAQLFESMIMSQL